MNRILFGASCMLTALGILAQAHALEVSVRVDKLQVRPGEPVQIGVTVSDPQAALTARVTHQVDTEAAVFTGAADAEGQWQVVFTPEIEWGYDVTVEAVLDGVTATASDVFACAANPFQVAVDYGIPDIHNTRDVLPDGSPAPEGPVQNPQARARIEREIARLRHQYINLTELYAVAYDTFSSIVPPVPTYFKGNHYNYSVNVLRGVIRDMKDNGMVTLMYVNGCVSGLGGTEFARRHPEYLAYTADGAPFGGLNLATMDIQQWYLKNYPDSLRQVHEWLREQPTPEAVRWHRPGSVLGPHPGFLNAWLDFRDPRVSEIGAEQIIAGQIHFGYHGVRYDGEYRVPSIGDPLAPTRDFRDWSGEPQPVGAEAEELTARNLALAYGMMREHNPDFGIGMNSAAFRSDSRGDRAMHAPEIDSVSPGVLFLDEVAKGALAPSHPDHLWENFIRNMTEQSDRVRQVDNHLFAGWGGGPGQKIVDTKQVKAAAWACGLRWICGGHSREDWFADTKSLYNRFALRYSRYILDNQLRRLSPSDAATLVQVESERPLFWDRFVQQREDRYWVMHLINRPLEDGLTPEAVAPPPARNITLTFAPDIPLGTVHLLSPYDAPVILAPRDRSVTIPELENWAIIVVEP